MRWLSRFLCLSALVLASGSCVPAVFFTITGVPAVSGTTCTVPSMIMTALSGGIYDVSQGALTMPYFLGVVLKNGVAPAGTQGMMSTVDTNDIAVQDVDANLQTVSGQSIGSIVVPVAGTMVDAGGGSAGIGFPVMDAAEVGAVAGLVSVGKPIDLEVTITVHGSFSGGGDVETQAFTFPIQVCKGCLITDAGACPVTGSTTGDPCNPAQDFPITCCHEAKKSGSACIASPLICPGPSTYTPPCALP